MSPEAWTQHDDDEWEKNTAHIDKELDSEQIDVKMPYSKQLPVIRQCLIDAYGEVWKSIKITNRFFLRLKDFIEYTQEVDRFAWERSWPDWKKVRNMAISWGNNIMSVIIHYNKDIDQQMEKDLLAQWKSQEEVDKIMKDRYNAFLKLLRERIQYEAS